MNEWASAHPLNTLQLGVKTDCQEPCMSEPERANTWQEISTLISISADICNWDTFKGTLFYLKVQCWEVALKEMIKLVNDMAPVNEIIALAVKRKAS